MLSVVGCRLWVCPIPIRITITLPLCQQPLPSFAIVCNISAPPCASRVTGWFPIEKKQRNEHDNQAIPYISDYGNNVNKLAEIVFYEDESDTAKAHGTVENPRLLSFSYNGNAEYLYIKVINGSSTKGYGFFEYLEVTYPALPDVLLENRIISEALKDRKENPDKASLVLEKTLPAEGSNTGKRYKEGDKVTITAEARLWL